MKLKFKFLKYLLILTSAFIFSFFLILSSGKMDETLEVWGEVSLKNQGLVYSPVDGFIDSICVKEGQIVEKNQLLALIKTKGGVNRTEILSPQDGMVFSPYLDELIGRSVEKDEVLMIITDPHQMGFQALVPEQSIPFVKEGLKANLFINAFPYQRFGTFQAEVTCISPAPQIKEGETFYTTTLVIDKPYVESESLDQEHRLSLKPGMKGKAKIITGSSKSILRKLIKRFLS